jgi:hypothetical protein
VIFEHCLNYEIRRRGIVAVEQQALGLGSVLEIHLHQPGGDLAAKPELEVISEIRGDEEQALHGSDVVSDDRLDGWNVGAQVKCRTTGRRLIR